MAPDELRFELRYGQMIIAAHDEYIESMHSEIDELHAQREPHIRLSRCFKELVFS
jgi:hypothetical protein